MAHMTNNCTSALFPTAVNLAFATFSDAHLQRILTWIGATQKPLIRQLFNPTDTPGFVPTNTQLYQAWVQWFVNSSISAEQTFSTSPPVAQAPVVIAP